MLKLFKISLIFAVVSILGNGCSDNGKISIIRNGKTSYSIYLDPSAPESVINAAEDLKSYFTKVTGASPEIFSGTQPPSTPFISLGSTSASKAEGLDASAIPNDGFRIMTKDKNLFILGPDTPTDMVNNLGGMSNGTSNGIYTFIEDYLGVQWLMPGELGEEYTKIKSVSVPELDKTEYSPFNYRVVSFRSPGPLEDAWDRHMKLAKVANVLHNHSWIETIPPSMFDEHPEWFASAGGKRIPPSGSYYKLETTNPGLVRGFADVIIETFRKDPNQRWYSLSPSDGGGFSDSPASKALTEKDPEGNSSYTPLVLKFYNDVAGLVRKEFPEHKLGGYIYGQYRYPPAAGLPELESNLALMLVGYTHHYRLYRPGMVEINEDLMKSWGESAKKDGFDIYFYDYPISMMAPNAIICPVTPDKLNFIFSHMSLNGFKGAYIYGNPVWAVSGPGNYIMAKLFWDPDQDARKLMSTYCSKAYGVEAAPYIEKIYAILDTAYNHFYTKNLKAGSALTPGHLREIYALTYQEIEQNYLQADAAKKEEKQQQRLELFGQVLSLMQWNLREYGFMPADYKSPLTLNADEIDQIMSLQHRDFQITRRGNIGTETSLKIEEMAGLNDKASQKVSAVPVYRNIRMLLHVAESGKVNVNVRDFNGNNEFIRYTFTDEVGKQLSAGVIARGRTIGFDGVAGKNYFLDIPSRGASMKLEVSGASIAYKTWPTAFQIAGRFMDGSLPLYFYVPKGIKSFNLTLGTRGTVDIISPDGRTAGQLINVSRKVIPVTDSSIGFWKVVLHKAEGNIDLTFDDQLPQWIIPDPSHPLKIEKGTEEAL